jgi:mRNA interferase MazF
MNRGDVVIVRFPFAGGRGGKYRPAVVVQNDLDNRRLTNTIVAMVSGNTRYVHLPTQVLLDPADPEGESAGVVGPSAMKATNLYTLEQRDVLRVIGHLTNSLMSKVDDSLRAALGLL